MAHGRKKAPAGYRWKTVTKLNALGRGYTTHVLVPLDSMESKFKEAEQESYKAFTPYPGQAVDPDVDRTPIPETQDQVWAGINPNLADSVESIKAGEKERAKFKDTWGASKPRMAGPGGATEQAYRELGSGNPFYAEDALASSTPFLDIGALTPAGKALGLSAAGIKIVADAVRKKGLADVVGDASKTVAGTKALTKVKSLVDDAVVTTEGKAAVNKGSKNLLGAKEDEYIPGLDVADMPKFTPRRVQTTVPVVKNLTGESKVIADGTIPPASTLPRSLIDDMPPVVSGSRTTPRRVGGDAARARVEAARLAAERDAAARASATIGPPKPKPFVGPPSPTSTVLGPPKKLYTDSASRAAVARRANLSQQKLLAGVAAPVIAGTVYNEYKNKNAAALAAAQAAKAKEPVGGSGYQQWDEGVQDAVQPDLGYARQASGALPRSNNVGGKAATEEQLAWADQYYGSKFSRDPEARYKKNKEFHQSLYKKMAILNAIAALTGNTSQAEQYAEYALGMHENAMQFDDDMRMHKMHKAVYFRTDGTFDPPKNSEEAYNRAIQLGASPAEAKEIYGFTPKKPALKQWWRRDEKGDVVTKQLPEGEQPTGDVYQWQQGTAREEREGSMTATGKRVAERDALIALSKAARAAGNAEQADAYDRNIAIYDSEIDPNSSPSVRATRIWNTYKDLHKGMGGNLLPKENRKSFEEWVKDESEGGGAMWARMHGLSSGQIMEGMGQSDNIVRISTQEEYDELPVGTVYIDGSGQPKKKGS
tara:strand:- start:3280 stop:5577 length:2298 start_codon:yes stop_codon:yes gene_type:complete